MSTQRRHSSRSPFNELCRDWRSESVTRRHSATRLVKLTVNQKEGVTTAMVLCFFFVVFFLIYFSVECFLNTCTHCFSGVKVQIIYVFCFWSLFPFIARLRYVLKLIPALQTSLQRRTGWAGGRRGGATQVKVSLSAARTTQEAYRCVVDSFLSPFLSRLYVSNT